MKIKFTGKNLKSAMSLLPFAFWVLLIFAFDAPYIGVCTLICAISHELGHIFAIFLLNSNFSLSAAFSGFRIKKGSTISYKKEAFIAVCGPLANIMIFIFLRCSSLYSNEYFSAFALLNLLTALSNLLPISGYDGYRILSCLVCAYGKNHGALSALEALSFFLVTLFCFISLYLMARVNTGFWIYFIFISALIKITLKGKRTKSEKKRVFKRF